MKRTLLDRIREWLRSTAQESFPGKVHEVSSRGMVRVLLETHAVREGNKWIEKKS